METEFIYEADLNTFSQGGADGQEEVQEPPGGDVVDSGKQSMNQFDCSLFIVLGPDYC